MNTCRNCGAVLPVRVGRGRRATYCSTRCRVAAHRAGRLPAELTSRDRWVRRDRKRPITLAGRSASSTNHRTWSTYEQVKASTRGHGIGFVLGDGVGCIDLDHCLTDGVPAPWAQAILDRLPDTYVEVSMSGDGLHVFGLLPPSKGRGSRGDGIEFYSTGRYIAVTGDRFGRSVPRLGDLSEVVATL